MARKVLAEFIERRAMFRGICIGFDREGPKYDPHPSALEKMCRDTFEDATSVIEMAPHHSSPQMVAFAWSYRMQVFEFFNNNRHMYSGFQREERVALEDIHIVLSDPRSREIDQELAREVLANVNDASSSDEE